LKAKLDSTIEQCKKAVLNRNSLFKLKESQLNKLLEDRGNPDCEES